MHWHAICCGRSDKGSSSKPVPQSPGPLALEIVLIVIFASALAHTQRPHLEPLTTSWATATPDSDGLSRKTRPSSAQSYAIPLEPRRDGRPI